MLTTTLHFFMAVGELLSGQSRLRSHFLRKTIQPLALSVKANGICIYYCHCVRVARRTSSCNNEYAPENKRNPKPSYYSDCEYVL